MSEEFTKIFNETKNNKLKHQRIINQDLSNVNNQDFFKFYSIKTLQYLDLISLKKKKKFF